MEIAECGTIHLKIRDIFNPLRTLSYTAQLRLQPANAGGAILTMAPLGYPYY